jgi:hypothetical protein
MATVTHSASLGWNTAELPPAGLARIGDLKIGDALWGNPEMSKQDYLDAAWITIEAQLGQSYVLPLPENLPRPTRLYLRSLHGYMASAAILIERTAGSDDVSPTGLWMRGEANQMLDILVESPITLDGLERRVEDSFVDPDTLLAGNVPGISTKDAISAFDIIDQVAHGTRDVGINPRVGRHEVPYSPGSGLTRR